MVKVEIKMDIEAPPKTIYDILMNDELESIWNLTVHENINIGEKKWSVKSTVGDLTSMRIEEVENKRITFDIDGSIFNKMGYVLTEKGDITGTSIWGEFDDENNRPILMKAGDILLRSLKRFSEFIEDGGNPEDFNKKELTVTP
jgi:hypothetical protein